MTEPRAMQEIHEIREQLSREMAGMSVEARAEWIRHATESFFANSGYKLVPSDSMPGAMRVVKAE